MSVLVEAHPTEDGSGAMSVTLQKANGDKFTVMVPSHVTQMDEKTKVPQKEEDE